MVACIVNIVACQSKKRKGELADFSLLWYAYKKPRR
jgi:hypothetical protein